MSSLRYRPPIYSGSSTVPRDVEILPICVCELLTDITYAGSGVLNPIGASPNWILQTDDTNSFNQSTQTYTCPLEGSYEIAVVSRPTTGFSLQLHILVQITNPNGTPNREYVLDYQRDAYHRGGYLQTPLIPRGSTIKMFWVIPTSGAPVFTGTTTITGYSRVHNWFSIKYDPRYRVSAGSLA